MKPLFYVAVVIILCSLAWDHANGQDNYVLCESPVSGERSVFQGTSCPSGWVFIQVVQ